MMLREPEDRKNRKLGAPSARRPAATDGSCSITVCRASAPTPNVPMATGASASIQEFDQTVIALEGLTDAEQAIIMPNNEQRVKVEKSWARRKTMEAEGEGEASGLVDADVDEPSGRDDRDGRARPYQGIAVRRRLTGSPGKLRSA